MRIKNWKKFQHFKDRCPPWIKLHRELLDQRDINLISDRSFRVLVFLWLLAAEDETRNGELPDIPTISFRLRMDESKITKSIQELGEWIDYSDINPISTRYQVVPPETETEAYKEETEKIDRSESFNSFWTEYPKKVGKNKAESAFSKIKLDSETFDAIMSGLDKYKNTKQWQDKQFIPHPSTWISQERWNDEIEAPQPEKQQPVPDKAAEAKHKAYEDRKKELEL